MLRTVRWVSATIVFWSSIAAAQVAESTKATIPHSTYVVLRGSIQLPIGGIWQPRSTSDRETSEIYLLPSETVALDQIGQRMGEVLLERRVQQSRWKLLSLHHPCQEYARNHHGKGPKSITDLDHKQYQYIIDDFQNSPWRTDVDLPADQQQPQGPFVFVVPEASFEFTGDRNAPASNRAVLAVELRPFTNDGQHWVLYTNGECVRQPIDEAFTKRHQIAILPVVDTKSQTRTTSETAQYTIVAVRRKPAGAPISIVLHNRVTGQDQSVIWQVNEAKPGNDLVQTLSEARRFAWQPYFRTGPAPVLRSWVRGEAPADRRRRANEASVFSLLGGRAAVEETLQLQDLVVSSDAQQAATIPVSSLPGVEVKSHPFQQMLEGQPGGSIELANYVPPDRFFLYVAKPESIVGFLDHGAPFLASAGVSLTGNQLDHDLPRRYMEKLGISRPWLEKILSSGVVEELAIMLPDLYLIDGTELTAVVRIKQPALLSTLAALIGVRDLGNSPSVSFKTASGGMSHWALRGDLLCASSHRDELQRVVDLIETHGEGSLGRSEEFRYMLTQLAPTSDTRMLAYLSDPFIRRLVGPQVKLAQYRRMLDRARMEHLTAQAMLARLDGVNPIESVEQLVRLKYLPEGFPIDEYSLDADGAVRSNVYGQLANLRSVRAVPVEQVTPAEAEAYRQYVDNYSRYWRQFFDPIAIRLNDAPDKSLEMTMFILPLIDSSIYESVRQVIVNRETGGRLSVPRIEPAAVLQLSVNLRDEAWKEVTRNFSSEFFRHYGGLSSAIFDDLGPSVHFAVFDADPIISFGSSDLLGAFGTGVFRGRGNDMFMLPIAMSMLTRPCSLYIETQNPERTARFLRHAAGTWQMADDNNDVHVTFYQREGRDSWIAQFDLFRAVKIRFGIEVNGRYLVIRNMPWSVDDRLAAVEDAPHNGASVLVSPEACRLQLPGLFAGAANQERNSAISGAGRLYPIILSGRGTADNADAIHQRLFGFRPRHPSGGTWEWRDFQVASSTYGHVWQQRQPDFDPTEPFGLFQGVKEVRVSMQLEDTGLRSTVRWKFDR
jgi:hypothetical protein